MTPEYELSTDKSRLDVDAIHRFLSNDSYWSAGISRGVVQTSIDNSLCFGIYQGAQQVAFARVITDRATFALLADVFVFREHRGRGLSKWLMRSVVAHPDLQRLRRMLLLTSDAHGLYRQFGFQEISGVARFMEVLKADIYKSDPPGAVPGQ